MTDRTHTLRGVDTYRRLLGYVRPHWRIFALAILGMIAASLTDVAFAALMKPLLDGSFVAKDLATTQWVPLALVGVFLVRAVGEFGAKYGMTWVARKVVSTLRQQVFDKLLRLPTRFFDHAQSGDLLARLTYTVEQVASAATGALTVLVRDGLSVIGLLAWMFWLSPQLTVFILVVAPIVVALIALVSRNFRRYSRRIQASVGEIAQVADEVVGGHRLVRVYGGEPYEQARFAAANERNRRAFMRMELLDASSTPIVQFLVAVAIASIIAFATSGERLEQLTVGTFISFITALAMLLSPLKRLTSLNATLQKGIAAGEQLFATLDEIEERDEGRHALGSATGHVRFEGVRFAYGEGQPEVLHGIDLDVPAGTTVAIVGQSGSGKTTLLNLLPRFYDPTGGRILIDGVDIRALPLADLRAQLAWVGQEITLFDDTVANNIAYGSLQGASMEAIRAAADQAQATAFIEGLPEGFETRVGERGVLLSGGQRQRIAIARALLRQAPILLLDEATSALDTASERLIQQALEGLMRHRTTLIIAHRLSTIRNADRIVVMDAGRIVEQGRHEELLARGGHYARLYRLQFSESGDGEG
ncbi:lipid A export permease/ATP-binding protein MsbA [Thiofaba sp. EF100]|uniref:lipid A export permease/ATP-binding protein MsbA n=1 Tax=Thiofaba sp. EF100 TaxID=3121274 RepID=UPI003221FD45